MKSFTNHTRGPRGINLSDGTTRWVEPGATVELDEKDIAKNGLPDLGKPGDAPVVDDGKQAALEAENAELRAQLAKFDPDGDGKAGGSVAAKK
jgi:hypothetical protein